DARRQEHPLGHPLLKSRRERWRLKAIRSAFSSSLQRFPRPYTELFMEIVEAFDLMHEGKSIRSVIHY
ncbi:hypothetical protein, partial [Pseudomonas citronellolis]|uniref:hypothetical protein n=1 Tax=Pseudomonas citronellolis TaxID=53408 RepID=UPI00248E084A